MANKSKRPKGSSAYRIKRARNKKPVRFLELAIMFLFVVVAIYVVSFVIQISKGYSGEKESTEYYINLQVLNGCGEKSLANRLANIIEMAVEKPLAIRIIDTDNFENFGVEESFVISRKSNLAGANLLAQQLNLTTPVSYREIENNYMDIGATLVLGADYKTLFDQEENKSSQGNR